MVKRKLRVDWSKVPGASLCRKKLYLRPETDGIYLCPDRQCLHTGFRSKRGCRKHIDSKHEWKYYFEERPNLGLQQMSEVRAHADCRSSTLQMPSFTTETGIGHDFKTWLGTPCGGGKNEKESTQSCKRAMKYLMYCSGTNDGTNNLDMSFVDCCLGSSLMVVDFLRELQMRWHMGFAGSLNYLKSIEDLMDFRKSHGVSDAVLRSFTTTEVYLRRGKRCLSRKRIAEWTRNFDLETLISQNSWATVDEMESVIPFHLPKFKEVLEKCKGPQRQNASVTELTFATRFITAFLFLSVKCSRPMTFQKLTVPMMEQARRQNGFVDQKEFKTANDYLFDTLIFTDDAQDLLWMYIDHCRPLLNPTCDNVLVNNQGKMCENLGHAMTIMVYEAISKHINPTRYRQIVETASSDNLTPEEQAIVSKDQKHTSKVAEVYYKKRHSREVASKGKECMDKLFGQSRVKANSTISKVLSDLRSAGNTFGFDVMSSHNVDQLSALNLNSESGNATHENMDVALPQTPDVSDVKMEIESNAEVEKVGRRRIFSTAEDVQLCQGIKRFGKGKWAVILKEGTTVFHHSRTRDALRMRAQSTSFKRLYKC